MRERVVKLGDITMDVRQNITTIVSKRRLTYARGSIGYAAFRYFKARETNQDRARTQSGENGKGVTPDGVKTQRGTCNL